MAEKRRIPNGLIATVADVMAGVYYSHSKLNTLLAEAGAPGEPPVGNCIDKCAEWLKRCNYDREADAFEVLGRFIETFMEQEVPEGWEQHHTGRQRINAALAKQGLSYHPGGRILGVKAGLPAKSLNDLLQARDLPAVQAEIDRALRSVESDPAASLTAACALIESLLKTYIEDESLEPPTTETVKPLWAIVSKHLGLDPATIEDEDIRRIGSGLSSIVDGVGALRTHAGSVHGRGRAGKPVAARHARLAIHAAYTLAAYVLESWPRK